jgi:hypothetical protein
VSLRFARERIDTVEPKVLNFEESSLESLGWSSFFQNQMANGGRAGRVASANHGRFLVWTADGEVDASVTGVLRKSGIVAGGGRLGGAQAGWAGD